MGVDGTLKFSRASPSWGRVTQKQVFSCVKVAEEGVTLGKGGKGGGATVCEGCTHIG